MTEYAVKAETFEGVVVILQRGFESRFEAEDHRVTMAKWKRVWIERIDMAKERSTLDLISGSRCGPSRCPRH